MLATLGIMVLILAILIFFSQEFIVYIKKLFSIPGITLFLPLVFASLITVLYEEWGQWLLFRIHVLLNQFLNYLGSWMPFGTTKMMLIKIIFLFLLASIPVWIFELKSKQAGRRYSQSLSYYLSLILWIVAVILLSIIVA